MARLSEIVIDCEHPAALARVWVHVLSDYRVRDYDAAELQRLASLGLTPETDPVVMVDGPGPTLCFQKMSTLSMARSRVHLDVRAANRAVEVGRLIALGATIAREGDDYTVLCDPEGVAFCVLGEKVYDQT